MPDPQAPARRVLEKMRERSREHRQFAGVPCQCESSWHADEIDGWVAEFDAALAAVPVPAPAPDTLRVDSVTTHDRTGVQRERHEHVPAQEPEPAVRMPVWRCKGCGCLWRDNLDNTVSLFDAQQHSCMECERDTPSACVIHWLQFGKTEAENAALRAERDNLRVLVEAGRQDEELLNRAQDADLTIREALSEREALRAERERLRAALEDMEHLVAEIAAMTMTAASDPNAPAATYRDALADVCNRVMAGCERASAALAEGQP